MKKKAQVSAEVIIIFAFVLMIFMFVSFSVINKQASADDIKRTFDLRAECNKLSNIISSVYNAGNGSTATFETPYFLTLPGNGSLVLGESANVSESLPDQNFAILASEAGATTQVFFDNMSSSINPDWYKSCFSDIGGGAGCQQWDIGMDVPSWNSIPWVLDDLMKNLSTNPSYYTTVYIEDPHIQFDAEYGGTDYMDILSDWVSQGNVLILSEHVRCREAMFCLFSWCFCINAGGDTSYMCNPPGCNYDVWNFLNIRLNQEGSSGWASVVNESDEFDFSIGQQFRIEERNFIENMGVEDFSVLARYVPGGSDYNNMPAITSWKVGNGIIYYFADFEVTGGMSQEDFTQALSVVIKEAYYILHFTSKTESCRVPVDTKAYVNLNGLIRLTNDNGRVIAEDLDGS